MKFQDGLKQLRGKSPTAWLLLVAILWSLAYFLGLPKITHIGQWLMLQSGPLESAVSFFLYEVPKVILLLICVVFCVGILRTFVSPEKTRTWLRNRLPITGHMLAASLGVVTPFCSCSAVPLFVGFVQGGVPLGITLSFLIAAPMVNEVALVMLFSFFGIKVAATYLFAGVTLAVGCGYLIGKMHLERYLEDWVTNLQATASIEETKLSCSQRIDAGIESVQDIVGRVWLYVVIGIAVGAGIHGYVPTGFFSAIMGGDAWWSVPVAVVLGIPMYSNAAGIFPVAQVLLEKGASLGTTLAFMMSVIGLSLPEAIILRKVLKLPLILIYFGTLTVGIILVGFLFNAFFQGIHL